MSNLKNLLHSGTYKLGIDLNGDLHFGTCRVSKGELGLLMSLDLYGKPSENIAGEIPIFDRKEYRGYALSTGEIIDYNDDDFEIVFNYHQYNSASRKLVRRGKQLVLRMTKFTELTITGYVLENPENVLTMEHVSNLYREIQIEVIQEKGASISSDIWDIISDKSLYRNLGLSAQIEKSNLSLPISTTEWSESLLLQQMGAGNLGLNSHEWKYIFYLVKDSSNSNGDGPAYIFPEKCTSSRLAVCIINGWEFPRQAGFPSNKNTLLDNPKAYARTFLHELGHGLGLGRDETAKPPFYSLMRPTSVIIINDKEGDNFRNVITYEFRPKDKMKIAHFADSFARPSMSDFNSFNRSYPLHRTLRKLKF